MKKTVNSDLFFSTDTIIACLTPALPEGDLGQSLPISVTVNYGEQMVNTHGATFTYRPNPVVEKISPHKTFLRYVQN